MTDTTPRIFVNHLGFRPSGDKHLVVTNPPQESFQVVSRMTKQVVFEGPLHRVSHDLGDAWTGCFSQVRDEGTYLIRCGHAQSHIVTIWENIYDYPCRILFNYFPSQRCGNTPLGWNSPCHTHDARRPDTGEYIDVSGGWHQSGDLRKWTWGTSHGPIGLTRFLLQAAPRWDQGQIADEIRWGNQYFHKMVRRDGGLMDHVILPLGWDEERDLYANDAPPVAMFLVIAAQSQVALAFEEADPTYSKACIDLARRLWDYLISPDRPQTPYAPPVIPKHHEWLAEACPHNYPGSAWHWLDTVLAATSLFQATRDKEWLNKAADAATQAARLQLGHDIQSDPAAACFRVHPHRPDIAGGILEGSLARIALCDLVELHPHHPDAPAWQEAIRRIAAQYTTMAQRNPWGLVPSYWRSDAAEGGRPAGSAYYRYFFKLGNLSAGVNYDAAANALFLLRAAPILGEPSLRALAFRQLDWILGCNPFDMSTVEGIGLNQPERFINPNEFFPPTPQIPGAVMTGIAGDDNDQPALLGCAREYDLPPTALLLWLLSELATERETEF